MRLKDDTMQMKLHISYPTLLHLLHSIFHFVLDSVCVCTAMLRSCVIPKIVHYTVIPRLTSDPANECFSGCTR